MKDKERLQDSSRLKKTVVVITTTCNIHNPGLNLDQKKDISGTV